jgi:hypothetical protein
VKIFSLIPRMTKRRRSVMRGIREKFPLFFSYSPARDKGKISPLFFFFFFFFFFFSVLSSFFLILPLARPWPVSPCTSFLQIDRFSNFKPLSLSLSYSTLLRRLNHPAPTTQPPNSGENPHVSGDSATQIRPPPTVQSKAGSLSLSHT